MDDPAGPGDEQLSEAIDRSRLSSTRVTLMWLALPLPTVVYILQVARLGRWIIDDALISAAYARSILLGSYSQTPTDLPVEGISNPLWTLLLAGLRGLGLFDAGRSWLGVEDYVVAIRILAVLSFVVIQVLLACGVRRVAGAEWPFIAAGAAFLLALSTPYVIWTASGLENPLYAALTVALGFLALTTIRSAHPLGLPRALGFSLVAIAIATTRPDGLVFLAVYPIVAVLLARRSRWRQLARALGVYFATCGGVLGGLLAWRWLAFGLLVPNTAVAKSHSFETRAAIGRAGDLAAIFGLAWLVLMICLVLIVFLQRRHRLEGVAVGVPVVLAGVAYLVLNTDWMGEYRFATPLLSCAALFTAVTAARVVLGSEAGLRVAVVGVTLAVTAGGTVQVMAPRMNAFLASPTVPGCVVAQGFGRQFNLYADLLGIRQGTLLLPDIGGTLLTSRLGVVDLAGLTNTEIGRLRGRGDEAAIRDYVINEVRPTFVHFHPPWSAGLESDSRFLADYVELGGPGGWVRRSAVRADIDLASVSAAGQAASLATGASDPLAGCGAFEIGGLPLRR